MNLPGLIDIHVHLRDPGQTQKEDFTSGSSAALAGGFTTVFDMPNNTIPITTKERLAEKIEIARKKTVCDIGFYFGSLGDNTDQFESIYDLVWGLKLYLNISTGGYIVDIPKVKALYDAWQSEKPILLHSEADMIDDVLAVIRETGKRSHICHISGEKELSAIIDAKENGIPVTCGVTPHHLFLTEEDAKRLGPFGMMKPPLKTKEDVDFLWKNLRYIDVVESDHAAHTIEEKKSESPPFGVPGLETTLPLLLTAVSENRLTMDDVMRLTYEGPRRILQLPDSKEWQIEVDRDSEYTIQNGNLFTKCNWSPFDGWKVKGKVRRVTKNGQVVFEDGKIIIKPGFGKIL